MTATEFHLRQRANPFVPYRIHLADGRFFRVPHPDYLAVSPTGRMASVFTDNGESHILDIFLITDLTVESPAEAEPPTSPGAGARP